MHHSSRQKANERLELAILASSLAFPEILEIDETGPQQVLAASIPDSSQTDACEGCVRARKASSARDRASLDEIRKQLTMKGTRLEFELLAIQCLRIISASLEGKRHALRSTTRRSLRLNEIKNYSRLSFASLGEQTGYAISLRNTSTRLLEKLSSTKRKGLTVDIDLLDRLKSRFEHLTNERASGH